ncbi:MAG: hypothetical protein Q8L68_07570, partial [Methylococcales bacterium]|nr:hypothetical protein [Methylococcales bacterium]
MSYNGHLSLGRVYISTILALTPRFSALRCSKIKALKLKLAKCKHALIIFAVFMSTNSASMAANKPKDACLVLNTSEQVKKI